MLINSGSSNVLEAQAWLAVPFLPSNDRYTAIKQRKASWVRLAIMLTKLTGMARNETEIVGKKWSTLQVQAGGLTALSDSDNIASKPEQFHSSYHLKYQIPVKYHIYCVIFNTEVIMLQKNQWRDITDARLLNVTRRESKITMSLMGNWPLYIQNHGCREQY